MLVLWMSRTSFLVDEDRGGMTFQVEEQRTKAQKGKAQKYSVNIPGRLGHSKKGVEHLGKE